MNKSILTLCLACGVAGAVNAKIAEVSAPEPILRGVETELYNPVLSADGTQLMFSNSDFTNLRVYDFESGAVSKVNANRHQAYTARFDADDQVTFNPRNSVRTEGSTLYITVNGKETGYTPVESYAGYLWESLSPDGTKVMFVAAGHGVVITDLQGNILADLGNYEYPVWYGNDNIIVQNATDDGHQYSSSRILLMRADGSEIQPITKPESMTFAPTASFEASKVVYTTIDGRLYQVTVNLNK